ncbi:MAG: nucleotidyltransferase domain-containing protein [Ramlibacter sp.]
MNASSLDSGTVHAVRAFMAGVVGQYPAHQAILFGSRARGTAHDESDADVAVLLKGKKGHFIKTKMALDDIAYEVLLSTGIRIQPLPVWEEEWAHPEVYSNPRLLQIIAREGIVL